MEPKQLLLIMSAPPHPSSLHDGKLPRRAEGTGLAVGELLAARADDQEVLMRELTPFEELFAAGSGQE